MKYVSYLYYHDEYLGKTIPTQNEFLSLCVRAETYIDKITDGHITEATDDIKNAVCAVCDFFYNADKQKGIKSESVDGYSATLDKDDYSQKELYNLACLFLPSYLLYRGI